MRKRSRGGVETLEEDVQCLQPRTVIGWGEERQRRRGLVEIMEDLVLGGLMWCKVQLWSGSVMM